jgi:hypothetical protein
MSDLYLEILDPNRKQVFNQLAAFAPDGYLAGGTALALQLNHRRSYDLDVFSPKPLSRRLVKKVIDIFGRHINIRTNTADFLFFRTQEQVQVHFVYYWYQRLNPLLKTTSLGLASLEDIAADKAQTIGRRGQWRDYVDLYFLIKKQFSLGKIINLAEKKFAPEFVPRLFLEQLSYFGDINDFEIDYTGESHPPEEVQKFLAGQVKQASKILK